MSARRTKNSSGQPVPPQVASEQPAATRSASPDPILEVIELHRRAFARFGRACRTTDDIVAKQEHRIVDDSDWAEWELANEAETEALDRLTAIVPTTAAGIRALLDYLRTHGLKRTWQEETSAVLLSNIMRAPLLQPPA